MSINWWPTTLSLLFFHKLLYSIARQDQLAGVVSWKIFEDNSEYKGKLAASSKTVHTLRYTYWTSTCAHIHYDIIPLIMGRKECGVHSKKEIYVATVATATCEGAAE